MSRQDREHDAERPQPDSLQVLAALRRAAVHRPGSEGAVSVRALLDHLALAPRSGGARSLRGALARLQVEGAVSEARRHGVAVYSLTAAGRARLQRPLQAPPPLPESPQHRAWRRARTAASLEIERFRESLRAGLREADALLQEGGEAVPSLVWFELGERLHRRSWLVGSATHCLHEWREPDDAHADLDADAGVQGAGRRNVRLWVGPL